MLNTHPDLFLPTEQYFLAPLIYRHVFYDHLNAGPFQDKLAAILQREDLCTWAQFGASQLPEITDSFASFYDGLVRGYGALSKDQVWGDTTPVNTAHLETINQAFPEAKYVFLIRDGRDTVASYQDYPTSFDHLPTFQAQVNYWLLAVRKYLWLSKKGDVHIVRYEDLVKNPREVLGALYKYLDVPDKSALWDNYLGTLDRDPFFEADQHRSLRSGITTKAIGRWKDQLTRDQLHICMKKMGKWLFYFKYPVKE